MSQLDTERTFCMNANSQNSKRAAAEVARNMIYSRIALYVQYYVTVGTRDVTRVFTFTCDN